MDAPGSAVNSRSSFVVKAAWSGPRRPIIDTWRTAERYRTTSTEEGTSYFSSMLGGVSSIHATSSTTFPWPMMVISTCTLTLPGRRLPPPPAHSNDRGWDKCRKKWDPTFRLGNWAPVPNVAVAELQERGLVGRWGPC
jgi:hypothetical protein